MDTLELNFQGVFSVKKYILLFAYNNDFVGQFVVFIRLGNHDILHGRSLINVPRHS